jgi:hypothetical protein
MERVASAKGVAASAKDTNGMNHELNDLKRRERAIMLDMQRQRIEALLDDTATLPATNPARKLAYAAVIHHLNAVEMAGAE